MRAPAVGRQSDRTPQTIMAWVHRYNEAGYESLVSPQRTGGHPPFAVAVEPALEALIRDALDRAATPPQARVAPTQPRWTLKRLVAG